MQALHATPARMGRLPNAVSDAVEPGRKRPIRRAKKRGDEVKRFAFEPFTVS
jgi:hypothetical protein